MLPNSCFANWVVSLYSGFLLRARRLRQFSQLLLIGSYASMERPSTRNESWLLICYEQLGGLLRLTIGTAVPSLTALPRRVDCTSRLRDAQHATGLSLNPI
jgi:hypothetical protein